MKAEERTAAAGAARIRVWDAPTRTFHWLYVAAFAAAWLTLDATLLDWHVLAGYVALGLLAFRVAWGFAGTRHARFASFAAGPVAVWRYLRGLQRREPIHYAGHNPAGGWSIFIMIALGIAIGVTGILALGAMYGYGPLSSMAAPASAAALREAHEVLAWILLALVPIHLAGVAVGSLAGRENLVRSMIDGRKNAAGDSSGVASRTLIAISLVAVAAAGAIAYRRHADAAIASARKPAKAAGDVLEKAWNEECGSCHFAFPASLAPERIWRAMLEPAADHFGEALDLTAPRRAALTTYAASHSADRTAPTWLAGRMSHTEWRSPSIVGTPFWRRRHQDIDFAALKKSGRVASAIDCGACHHDAASGTFAPRAIEMP